MTKQLSTAILMVSASDLEVQILHHLEENPSSYNNPYFRNLLKQNKQRLLNTSSPLTRRKLLRGLRGFSYILMKETIRIYQINISL